MFHLTCNMKIKRFEVGEPHQKWFEIDPFLFCWILCQILPSNDIIDEIVPYELEHLI